MIIFDNGDVKVEFTWKLKLKCHQWKSDAAALIAGHAGCGRKAFASAASWGMTPAKEISLKPGAK